MKTTVAAVTKRTPVTSQTVNECETPHLEIMIQPDQIITTVRPANNPVTLLNLIDLSNSTSLQYNVRLITLLTNPMQSNTFQCIAQNLTYNSSKLKV